MKQFLIPLLLGALPAVARAQVPPVTLLPPDTARVFKHELGLIAQPLLTQSIFRAAVLPVGLVYRQQISPHGFVRLTLTGYQRKTDTAQLDRLRPYYYYEATTIERNAGIWIGYERHLEISGRLGAFWGIDAGLQHQLADTHKAFREIKVVDTFQTFETTRIIDTRAIWSWQMRPLAGLRYQIAKRAILVLESGAVLAWQKLSAKLEARGYYDPKPPGFIDGSLSPAGNFSYTRTIAALKPIQSISLVFLF